jgi:hypothetical protein
MLSPYWHGRGLLNTCWDTFCVLACMGGVWSTHMETHVVSSLAWDGFGITKVEIFFVSSLAWDGFRQLTLRCILCHLKFRYIFCPPWPGRGLFNICWYAFSVVAGLGVVCQHMLRYILCPRWHVRGFVNTRWVTFCLLAGMWGVWSTLVGILL